MPKQRDANSRAAGDGTAATAEGSTPAADSARAVEPVRPVSWSSARMAALVVENGS